MSDWPWQTIWAAINAIAAGVAAIGAWLAFRVALAAYRAEHRPIVILTRAHGKTSVRSVGRGTAFQIVAVGDVGAAEPRVISIATALNPGDEVGVSENSFDYSVNYGNALFFSDNEDRWYFTRAVAVRSLRIDDNVTFSQGTHPIDKSRIPKDVIDALNPESVYDWLQKRKRE